MQRRRERGSTLVLVAVGMLALIAMAGLAIDTAHVLLNKSRLQSALDAAALAAAKVLDQTASPAQATAAASSEFTLNLAQYPELQGAIGGGAALTTEYSATLVPFAAGTTPAAFVRASITGFRTSMSLVSVLGINSIAVAGNAVAGPSPAVRQACNIVPVLICANPGGGGPLHGYAVNQVVALNQLAGAAAGPGNYGLLALGGNVSANLAGDYNTCAAIGQTVATDGNVASGQISQGINTRFNQYQGPVSPAQYPPDVINSAAHQTNLTTDANGNITQAGKPITTANQLTFNYADYAALVAAGDYDTQPMPRGPAGFGRRIIAAPIANCAGAGGGGANVLGFACVFLLQTLSGNGKNVIYGQVIQTCDAGGRPGAGSGTIGPHVIELYKSAGSPDS